MVALCSYDDDADLDEDENNKEAFFAVASARGAVDFDAVNDKRAGSHRFLSP